MAVGGVWEELVSGVRSLFGRESTGKSCEIWSYRRNQGQNFQAFLQA
jgi:hypothetical protein